jgi:CRP/FNR family transcriptional regulator
MTGGSIAALQGFTNATGDLGSSDAPKPFIEVSSRMERTRELARAVNFGESSAMLRSALLEPIARGAIDLHHAAASHRRHLAAHTELIRSEEPQSELGILLKGWACRYRLLPDGRRQILDVHLPGDLIGLDGFLMTSSQDFVVTLTEVTFGSIDHDRFQRLIASPDIALQILSMLAAERRRLDGHLATVGQMAADEKIAALLLEFYVRLRHRQIIRGKSFHFPLTQQQLGDFLGMTVVHVNRVLKRLRDSGIVNVKHRVVVIHDMARLADLASGRPRTMPLPHIAGAAPTELCHSAG